jgi:hypothetical protein
MKRCPMTNLRSAGHPTEAPTTEQEKKEKKSKKTEPWVNS